MSRVLTGLLLIALAACGARRDLSPAEGNTLPPKPAQAVTAPTPEEMLEVPAQAEPDRVNDPLRRSQDRPEDPFDLPPL